jgi:glutathione peroxidase
MTFDRRVIWKAGVAGMLGALAGPIAGPARSRAATNASSLTAYVFSFDALDGPPLALSAYAGRPVLVVNTASLCVYSPQYAGLQELWERFAKDGLALIAVPSNDFGGQEPGGAAEIQDTASHYGVTFPIAAKTIVQGADAHPFYKWAAHERPHDVPRWNFHKYLVGRDGYLADVFASDIEPTDTRVITAIARQLHGASQQPRTAIKDRRG